MRPRGMSSIVSIYAIVHLEADVGKLKALLAAAASLSELAEGVWREYWKPYFKVKWEDSTKREMSARCGFEADRDVIAIVNIYRRYVAGRSRCGAPGVNPERPRPDESPGGAREIRVRL
ncbi:MAG: hypothetical protein RXR70_02490 [Acidilobus sp.]